ncbi:hypothetical protein [Flavobacterium alvei]|uniref:hypothetical protein n=1 Tax=Flavobacterium alvei TaxID=2080416 RepID=UPI001FAFB78E|nr:hypothetical protein [Flavobacterium alvei]
MRNLTVYLVLLLCFFAGKMLAQETYEQALEKTEIKFEQIKQEEEKAYNEEVEKLKTQQKNGIISKQEFKDKKIVLEKKKESNIKERGHLEAKKIRQKFPELGAKSYTDRAERITEGIKNDIEEEKKLLKTEIETVDKQLIDGVITKKQAEEQKLQLAETRAKIIESKVADRQKALSILAQDEIDGKLSKDDSKGGTRITIGGNNNSNSDIGNHNDFVFPAMKAYNGQKDKDRQQSKRTTSQFVFAIGNNNLVTEGAVANSDFRYWQSRFYEWGFTFNSRISNNHNLLHAKYGLSLMYNDLKPTDNRYFVDNGNQTNLETNPVRQDDSRFRNVNLVIPFHLEFDFTKPTIKNGTTYFKSHDSFRLGIGGYFGANVKSKQILKYDLDGYHSEEKTKGDFNTNGFVYGLSTYLGYKATSLYLKYDLNTLFENNPVDQNNISLGIRFDFN